MTQDIDLATKYRQIYRARFRADVEAGTAKPFVLPFYLLGVWFLPTLYLAIPHKNRPWLYNARWPLLVFLVFFHFKMATEVSSLNFAAAYAVGLIAAWSTIWNFTLFVWTRPQWDAKRVDIRRKPICNKDLHENPSSHESSRLSGVGSGPHKNGEKKSGASYSSPTQKARNAEQSVEQEADRTSSRETSGNDHKLDGVTSFSLRDRRPKRKLSNTITDITNANPQTGAPADSRSKGTEQEFEYYWQAYPDDGTFLTRLDWAFDIVSTFRMTGWNWAIHCLPPYHPPPYTAEGAQLPLSALPNRSKEGYTRTISYRSFFFSRLLVDIIPSYILLDFCAVTMMGDPYFIRGPEHGLPLPPDLAGMHPLLLSLRRTAISLFGTIIALQLAFAAGAFCLTFLLRPLLGFRTHPWHLPSAFGSFEQVLDRGLAGFWGAWWHQTFRFGFEAPARWWLARRRHHHRHNVAEEEEKGDGGGKKMKKTKLTAYERLVTAAIAFLQSGLIHAAGSYSTVPASKWWQPPLFFALAGAGTVLQQWLAASLPPPPPLLGPRVSRSAPRWVRQLGNLAFALAWLWATGWLLVDDFGRCGLWLYEPVPVSLFRALGYGPPEDRRVWRYDADFLPYWHLGGDKRWWGGGIVI